MEPAASWGAVRSARRVVQFASLPHACQPTDAVLPTSLPFRSHARVCSVGTGVMPQAANCPRIWSRSRVLPIWHGELPQSRPLGVREVQTIEYRLYRTIEPKQRGAGARVSSDARRVCDASGQEEGDPVAYAYGEEGVDLQVRYCNPSLHLFRKLLYIPEK